MSLPFLCHHPLRNWHLSKEVPGLRDHSHHQFSSVKQSCLILCDSIAQFSLVQLLSHVRLFATPGIAAHQASLSITNSRSSLRLRRA